MFRDKSPVSPVDHVLRTCGIYDAVVKMAAEVPTRVVQSASIVSSVAIWANAKVVLDS